MGKWKEINSLQCKRECSYLIFNGKIYRGVDLLTCLDGAMKYNGSSLMDRYGIDPIVDLMDTCNILDMIISDDGNGVIGIDVLSYNGQSYFAIYFKKEVLCYWDFLDSFAKAKDYKIAYFMHDTGDYFIATESEDIVVAPIEV
jgi:hypothetical protein